MYFSDHTTPCSVKSVYTLIFVLFCFFPPKWQMFLMLARIHHFPSANSSKTQNKIKRGSGRWAGLVISRRTRCLWLGSAGNGIEERQMESVPLTGKPDPPSVVPHSIPPFLLHSRWERTLHLTGPANATSILERYLKRVDNSWSLSGLVNSFWWCRKKSSTSCQGSWKMVAKGWTL